MIPEARLQEIEAEVGAEVRRALAKFPSIASPHEGKAVIEEELDELWDEIKANAGREKAAMTEAIQVAAMAIRYVLDLRAALTEESEVSHERSQF